MNTTFVLIVGMLLAGCSGIPTKTGTETMTVTLMRDYDAHNICYAISGRETPSCTYVKDRYCLIILHPEHIEEVWGHELRHCFDGMWHLEDSSP